MNQRYDRFISIGRIADVRKRREALRKFDQEVRAMQEKITDSKGYCFEDYLLKAPHTEISQRVANVFAGLLMPALNAIIGAEERSNLGRQMEQVAFALAAYRADRGQYPETLDALVPNYIAEAPDDTFAEKPTPIRYERTADAWRMWSVGNNGIDDGGRNQNDDPKGDDWVLEPAVKK